MDLYNKFLKNNDISFPELFKEKMSGLTSSQTVSALYYKIEKDVIGNASDISTANRFMLLVTLWLANTEPVCAKMDAYFFKVDEKDLVWIYKKILSGDLKSSRNIFVEQKAFILDVCKRLKDVNDIVDVMLYVIDNTTSETIIKHVRQFFYGFLVHPNSGITNMNKIRLYKDLIKNRFATVFGFDNTSCLRSITYLVDQEDTVTFETHMSLIKLLNETNSGVKALTRCDIDVPMSDIERQELSEIKERILRNMSVMQKYKFFSEKFDKYNMYIDESSYDYEVLANGISIKVPELFFKKSGTLSDQMIDTPDTKKTVIDSFSNEVWSLITSYDIYNYILFEEFMKSNNIKLPSYSSRTFMFSKLSANFLREDNRDHLSELLKLCNFLDIPALMDVFTYIYNIYCTEEDKKFEIEEKKEMKKLADKYKRKRKNLTDVIHKDIRKNIKKINKNGKGF